MHKCNVNVIQENLTMSIESEDFKVNLHPEKSIWLCDVRSGTCNRHAEKLTSKQNETTQQ